MGVSVPVPDSGGPVTATDKIILLNLFFYFLCSMVYSLFCDKGWEVARYHI